MKVIKNETDIENIYTKEDPFIPSENSENLYKTGAFKMKYYVVDTFADTIFKGNPAGVCLLEGELEVTVMQSIAAENNLSETAFVIKRDGYYDLRWFTPKVEIDLCGHATLGSAYVIMNYIDDITNEVRFETKSGALTVKRKEDLYELDFPARKARQIAITTEMEQAISVTILEAWISNNARDLLLLLENERQIKSVNPDFDILKALASHAVTITAKGDTVDFVSRFFAPNMGVSEDPVTGSAHTGLIPFWAERLNKNEMTAMQLSKRGGALYCENCGDKVKIAGKAALYLQGEVFIR